jgi:hypothetical protein
MPQVSLPSLVGSEAEIQLQNRKVTVSAYTNQLTLPNLQL